MVNFLRRSGETDLNFFSTIVIVVSGKIMNFYKFFIMAHSKTHNRQISHIIAYSNMASFIGVFLLPFIYVIAETIFVYW